jgi:hypothetical protein
MWATAQLSPPKRPPLFFFFFCRRSYALSRVVCGRGQGEGPIHGASCLFDIAPSQTSRFDDDFCLTPRPSSRPLPVVGSIRCLLASAAARDRPDDEPSLKYPRQGSFSAWSLAMFLEVLSMVLIAPFGARYCQARTVANESEGAISPEKIQREPSIEKIGVGDLPINDQYHLRINDRALLMWRQGACLRIRHTKKCENGTAYPFLFSHPKDLTVNTPFLTFAKIIVWYLIQGLNYGDSSKNPLYDRLELPRLSGRRRACG